MAHLKLLIILVFNACLVGCVSGPGNQFNTHQYGTLDLSKFNSFKVEPGNSLYPEANEHLNKIIADKFINKGLVQDTSNPDLLVTYMLLTKEQDRLVLDTIENQGYIQPHAELVAEFYGGINVQVIDLKKRATLWHASASRNLTNSPPGIDDDRASKDLDELFSTIRPKAAN